MMEDSLQMLPPQSADPISRPSSTSTSASATLPQLPGIAALAASNAANGGAPESPQLRATTAPQTPMNTGISHAATSGGGSGMPVCQNCTTSTTPLWRRDEFGAVLCNACGLFLKLHGRNRPISLKTDVIKSRNRVKTIRPDLASKKKQQQQQQQVHNPSALTDANGAELLAQNAATAAQAIQRSAQKNGTVEGTDSPVSRTGTPSMYNQGLTSFMVDDPYQTGFNGATGADGSGGSPMNGDRSLESPQTHEQLIAHNSSLKTRVSELEVINELFRGRLSQLEQQEAAARRGQEVAGAEQTQLRTQLEALQESEAQLRAQLEDSHRRENNLKRRLDELELEFKEAQGSMEMPDRPAKKPRLEEQVQEQDEIPISEELVSEPTAEPAAESAAESAAEPAAEPVAEPVAEPEPTPAPEAEVAPEQEAAPEAEVPHEPDVAAETETETPLEAVAEA